MAKKDGGAQQSAPTLPQAQTVQGQPEARKSQDRKFRVKVTRLEYYFQGHVRLAKTNGDILLESEIVAPEGMTTEQLIERHLSIHSMEEIS